MNSRPTLIWLLGLVTALAPASRSQDANAPAPTPPPQAATPPTPTPAAVTIPEAAAPAAVAEEPATANPANAPRERLTEAEREARRAARRAQRQADRRAAQSQGQAQGQATPAASTGDVAPPDTTTPSSSIGQASSTTGVTPTPTPPVARPPTVITPNREAPARTVAAPAAPAEAADIRLNFRGVPLEMVLNHLSEAAGFIIVLETQVRGNVDVWSNQPLTRTEAVDLLNTVLGKNGYAAIRNGRTLTIATRDEAKKRNLPVKSGNDPEAIPKSEEMVTQILPVRYINAPQLVRDLQSLMPPNATVASNEGGNAIVITDTQVNIRRLAEIVAALDTTVSGVATIRVFPLRYADSKALATTLRDLFTDTTSNNRGGNNAASGAAAFLAQRFGGGGFPGAGGAGRGGGGGSSSAANPTAAKRVVAVADEHSNSLIVSASEDVMPTIEQLIRSVDTDVQDLTELRVFPLKFSDPHEMADLLGSLFPDTSSSSTGTAGGGFRFGGGPFPGGGGRNQAQTAESDRQKKQGKVIAVADPRTSSVVVSAAKELMPQIEAMVAQLDANPARKQKVFVYSLENANVQEVEDILRGLFESQNSRNTSLNNNQQNNALQNRAQNANRQQGLGTAQRGLGGGGLGGGNTGGGLR